MSRKVQILGTIDDLVSKFLYYDRKDDEDLSREELYRAISDGEIIVEEIVKRFEETLKIGLQYK
jgi:hypothetical protein